jgi:hypothetical protein
VLRSGGGPELAFSRAEIELLVVVRTEFVECVENRHHICVESKPVRIHFVLHVDLISAVCKSPFVQRKECRPAVRESFTAVVTQDPAISLGTVDQYRLPF